MSIKQAGDGKNVNPTTHKPNDLVARPRSRPRGESTWAKAAYATNQPTDLPANTIPDSGGQPCLTKYSDCGFSKKASCSVSSASG